MTNNNSSKGKTGHKKRKHTEHHNQTGVGNINNEGDGHE